MATLSPRRRAFVRAYLAGPPGVRGNGTQAAISAGYSPVGAGEQGSRLLTNLTIRAEVDRGLAKFDVTADRVIAEMAAIAFHDVKDFLSWDEHGVMLKPSAGLEHAAPVAEVSEQVSEHGTAVKIKFHDKRAALADLAKITGLMRDGTSVTVNALSANVYLPENLR